MSKDLKTLLKELDTVQRELYRIETDDEYITAKAREIFKNRTHTDYRTQISELMSIY